MGKNLQQYLDNVRHHPCGAGSFAKKERHMTYNLGDFTWTFTPALQK
jgi:hypothetical protein